MLCQIPDSVSKLFLHTGNMLYYTDVTKQVNMATTEQIVEGLKTCLSCEKLPDQEDDSLRLRRSILINQTDEDKKNLQTMVKVFVPTTDLNYLHEALEYTLSDLELPCIDSVILSCQVKEDDSDTLLDDLLLMWKILEELVNKGQITSIGISDVSTETFVNLYKAVEVKPSINQINLTACCVVPQDLQEFCKEHDIRILTHNDPVDILPVDILKPLFRVENDQNEDDETKSISSMKVAWVTRFQAHIKCRGILSNKGYIVCLHLK
ncbi:hypothetical protein V9T40_004318 [Parthenolecanium corni]|uniref:GCS light chain n=1 Tax=Parthenolecanium corni TaxID=536013 RepID=A0AAN9TWE4_9HEMI